MVLPVVLNDRSSVPVGSPCIAATWPPSVWDRRSWEVSLDEPKVTVQSLLVTVEDPGSTLPKLVTPGVSGVQAVMSSWVALGTVIVTTVVDDAAPAPPCREHRRSAQRSTRARSGRWQQSTHQGFIGRTGPALDRARTCRAHESRVG